jgi:hypothetical protein
MTLNDITAFYGYKRQNLSHKQTESHNPDAACAIKNCFLAYGWSFPELLRSKTKVMAILTPHLRSKRLHADDGPRDSEPGNKRRRVDRPGAFTSCPDNDFQASSLDQFLSGSIDRATSSGSDNTVESMNISNSSHLISFDARNGTRNLTDPAMMDILNFAFNNLDELTDPATMDDLSAAFNSSHELTKPAAMGSLDYTFDNSDGLGTINGLAADELSYAADLLHSWPNPGHETDASVDEVLCRTFTGSDPSRHMFLQGAISAAQLPDDFTYQSMPHISSPTKASTPGSLDPRT